MTEEEQKTPEELVKNVQKDEINNIANLPAVMVNRAYATPFGPFLRLTFGEFIPDAADVKMRSSIVMSLDDATGLLHLLNQAIQACINVIETKEKEKLSKLQATKEQIQYKEEQNQKEFLEKLQQKAVN